VLVIASVSRTVMRCGFDDAGLRQRIGSRCNDDVVEL
jgi:hypothetical protein